MPLFPHLFLRRYLCDRLVDVNVGKQEATLVADNLVDASLKGHDSHGVGKLPQYIAAIKAGKLHPAAHATKAIDAGPLLSFSGQRGFGQVVAREALEEGIVRAKAHGVAVVGLADAHHVGRLGAWAEQAAAAGLISLHFANVQTRAMVVPWQGRLPRMGTNPFCAGLPMTGRSPFILDFATSTIAANKARVAWNEGRQLPEGCLLDAEGQPTTDPRWMVEDPKGALLPFGQHKGSGLSMVCSLLGAALTGGSTECTRREEGPHTVNNMLSILIAPDGLGQGEHYQRESKAFIDWIYQARDEGPLRVPGDSELESYQTRIKEGIPVDEVTWQQLEALE